MYVYFPNGQHHSDIIDWDTSTRVTIYMVEDHMYKTHTTFVLVVYS